MPLALASAVLGITIVLGSPGNSAHLKDSTFRIVPAAAGYAMNGAPVSPLKVERLADALSAPAIRVPTPAALGLDRAALTRDATMDSSTCAGITSTPQAWNAFADAYVAGDGLQRSLETYYAAANTPRMHLAARILVQRRGAPDISAVSDSGRAGMLPWAVSDGAGAPRITYDAAISAALEALLEPLAASRDPYLMPARLLLSGVSDADVQWREAICTKQLQDFALHAFLPQTLAYAQRSGIDVQGFLAGAGPTPGFEATLALAAQPHLVMSFGSDTSGGDAAVLENLKHSEALLRRVAAIPWLQRVASRPGAQIHIDDPSLAASPLNAMFVDNLQQSGHAELAEQLARELPSSLQLWIAAGKGETQWFLLPNDDMLLVAYQPWAQTLPFDDATNARVAARGKLLNPPNIVVVAAVVHPDGTIDSR